MRFTLRSKLILLTTLLVTIIMAESTYFYTIREMKAKRAAVEDQIERIARNIATIKLLDQQDWSDYQDYINQIMNVNDDIVYIAIYDDRQSLRAHTLNTELVDIEISTFLSRTVQGEYVSRLDRGEVTEDSRDDLRTQRVNIQIGDRILGRVHVGFSLIKINDEINDNIIFNVVMALVFIAIFSGLAAMLSRRLTRPLERLSGAMSAIVTGDLDQEVVVENRDEIGKLSNTFNDMVKGLRERSIIEDLGRQLRFTFQLDRLTTLVQNRLGGAIGAESARLFLRKRRHENCYMEAMSEENKDVQRKSVLFDEQADSFFSKNEDGFSLNTAPEGVKDTITKLDISLNNLIIPMFVKGNVFGFISFRQQKDQPEFDLKQRHFASILANQAALALENATLYDELREQERLKQEIEIAREIQKSLLPTSMPDVNGFQFDGVCVPASEVGGDYFDLFEINEKKTGIVIADVSGKGTSASLYMAEIKGMMSILAPVYASPKKLLIELNRRLFGRVDRKVFTTMIYGLVDHDAEKFIFARAGHNSLLRLRATGEHEFLTPGGIGLGLTSGELFNEKIEEVEINLNCGDTVLLYTDGITEAMNKNRELYGDERLIEIINLNSNFGPETLRNNILSSVKEFESGVEQYDDITMVLCHRRLET